MMSFLIHKNKKNDFRDHWNCHDLKMIWFRNIICCARIKHQCKHPLMLSGLGATLTIGASLSLFLHFFVSSADKKWRNHIRICMNLDKYFLFVFTAVKGLSSEFIYRNTKSTDCFTLQLCNSNANSLKPT